jgi:hypothetical protein
METTITLECTLEIREHLRELEHELKQIHGLKVFFVEPRDADAPVLISISVLHKGEQADLAIRRIAHSLYEFVHSSAEEAGRRKLTLVTIEGESVDIKPLSSEEIRQIIAEAHAGQAG